MQDATSQDAQVQGCTTVQGRPCTKTMPLKLGKLLQYKFSRSSHCSNQLRPPNQKSIGGVKTGAVQQAMRQGTTYRKVCDCCEQHTGLPHAEHHIIVSQGRTELQCRHKQHKGRSTCNQSRSSRTRFCSTTSSKWSRSPEFNARSSIETATRCSVQHSPKERTPPSRH